MLVVEVQHPEPSDYCLVTTDTIITCEGEPLKPGEDREIPRTRGKCVYTHLECVVWCEWLMTDNLE